MKSFGLSGRKGVSCHNHGATCGRAYHNDTGNADDEKSSSTNYISTMTISDAAIFTKANSPVSLIDIKDSSHGKLHSEEIQQEFTAMCDFNTVESRTLLICAVLIKSRKFAATRRCNKLKLSEQKSRGVTRLPRSTLCFRLSSVVVFLL